MGQRAVPAPFLMKTYQMVDDESTNEIISWGEKGTTFVVWKTAEFSKDLLPNYFKHNNFSSFVRQLNTYGFRKIVSDKWEFANDNFRRGQKELLVEMHRRKTTTPPADVTGKPLHVSSGEDAGSSSTSSPGSKNSGSSTTEITELSGENEKLKRDNEILSSELAQTRKQCDELMRFLTRYLKVEPDQINKIMKLGSGMGTVLSKCGTHENLGDVGGDDDGDGYLKDDDEKVNEDDCSRMRNSGDDGGLKLFGVWLKDGKKRGRYCDGECNMGLCGSQAHQAVKAMKTR